mmetsp:Transcript_15916/g.21978  ORF Transcript_15916/g.21978 Transcript_15916/m.21978 type:complete len:252 (-) Transcript_15916:765-1520(-)
MISTSTCASFKKLSAPSPISPNPEPRTGVVRSWRRRAMCVERLVSCVTTPAGKSNRVTLSRSPSRSRSYCRKCGRLGLMHRPRSAPSFRELFLDAAAGLAFVLGGDAKSFGMVSMVAEGIAVTGEGEDGGVVESGGGGQVPRELAVAEETWQGSVSATWSLDDATELVLDADFCPLLDNFATSLPFTRSVPGPMLSAPFSKPPASSGPSRGRHSRRGSSSGPRREEGECTSGEEGEGQLCLDGAKQAGSGR